MKIYESKRHAGVTAKLLEERNVEGTVMMEYISGDKSGKAFDISKSTLKRWWKLLDEDLQMEEGTQEITPASDPIMDDSENVEVIEQDVDEKSKPKKNKRIKIDTTGYLDCIQNKLEQLGYLCSFTPSVKCLKVKQDKKTVCEIYLRSKNIEIRCREVKTDKFFNRSGYKYYLPVHIWIDYTDNYLENILSTL